MKHGPKPINPVNLLFLPWTLGCAILGNLFRPLESLRDPEGQEYDRHTRRLAEERTKEILGLPYDDSKNVGRE